MNPNSSRQSDPIWRTPFTAVIFDLDGTLTRPYLDFDVIRREIGLPTKPRTPVLEALEKMTPEQRERAERIVHTHEEQAAEVSELQDGAAEVLDALRERGLRLGLLTRNSRRSAERVMTRHQLRFDCVFTREDGPVKPSPQPVLAICNTLNVKPEETLVVGDYLFDIQAGNAAGSTTVLMIGDKPRPDFADLADHVIHELRRLLELIEGQ